MSSKERIIGIGSDIFLEDKRTGEEIYLGCVDTISNQSVETNYGYILRSS